jgi:hypothetical protein
VQRVESARLKMATIDTLSSACSCVHRRLHVSFSSNNKYPAVIVVKICSSQLLQLSADAAARNIPFALHLLLGPITVIKGVRIC